MEATKTKTRQTIAFAYFADGKFIGWYADSFGSVREAPKLYPYSEDQMTTIGKNFKHKLDVINGGTYEQAKADGKVFGLFSFDHEDELRGKNVELHVVACPYYSGPNPDFDEDEYKAYNLERKTQMDNAGVFNHAGASIERINAVREFNLANPERKFVTWIDADYELVKVWAATEPTEFLNIIKAV